MFDVFVVFPCLILWIACVFGSMMNVNLVNEGPVTLIIDSKQLKGG